MNDNPETPSDSKSSAKAPIVRGARACTTCRQAKMKCVGAEDGLKPCQRCKRANVECVFEKHRRGRKPGSKLSEASKMLRRLEKGLNTAKLKSQAAENAEPRTGTHEGHFSNIQPLESVWGSSNAEYSGASSSTYPNDNYGRPGHTGRSMEDDDEDEHNEDMIRPVPAEMIKSETRRNTFFKTILNPMDDDSSTSSNQIPSSSLSSQARSAPQSLGVQDPISAGIITEEDAKALFDILYLRLNPFINLFDPALHTVTYVRSKCPFLFTTIIMAACKFFKPEAYKPCQKLANELAVKAFADAWKRVEVVQAFACLTYWSIPEDNRTWTYIGYACRMAVELGLNRYNPHPPANESELQKLERRNRERTYLVLWVHDRSLGLQNGKPWMLQEDDLVKNSGTWHKDGDSTVRHEDIIVAAFVALRRVAVSDVNASAQCSTPGGTPRIDYNILKQRNRELEQWTDHWTTEMERGGGQKFHTCLLSFFSLHVKLYLNSYAVRAIKSSNSATSDDIESLRICFRSAREALRIVSEDYASMGMLRYGQDSILVMSAFSAIILTRLLRSPAAGPFLQISDEDVYRLIRQTASAYKHTSTNNSEIISTLTHARFLENLVTTDIFSRNQRERHGSNVPLDPNLMGSSAPHNSMQAQAHSGYVQQSHPVSENHVSYSSPAGPSSHSQPYNQDYLSSPRGNHGPTSPPIQGAYQQYQGYVGNYQQSLSEQDAHYQRLMFSETNFGEPLMPSSPSQYVEGRAGYTGDTGYGQTSYGHSYTQQPMPYTHPHSSVQSNYGY